jgi:multidrug resistance efflux pump
MSDEQVTKKRELGEALASAKERADAAEARWNAAQEALGTGAGLLEDYLTTYLEWKDASADHHVLYTLSIYGVESIEELRAVEAKFSLKDTHVEQTTGESERRDDLAAAARESVERFREAEAALDTARRKFTSGLCLLEDVIAVFRTYARAHEEWGIAQLRHIAASKGNDSDEMPELSPYQM